jgi:3',5'-cyclic AMP phosphodiesterase CpdA
VTESSRHSEEGAGWQNCPGPGTWQDGVPVGTRPMSWLRPSVLWRSRNDLIAKVLGDPTAAARARWVELARQRTHDTGANPDFVIPWPAADTMSALLIGDTGEGDSSQYAVAGPLTEASKTADLIVICSDVVYPAGDHADYGRTFHQPYRDIKIPIYAVPGNHDWYDGLHGFMHHFCGLDDPGYHPDFGDGVTAWLAGLLWRRPTHSQTGTDTELPSPGQPAPYFAIDVGPVRFVGIDTGITGEIDEEQYRWLRRVSLNNPRPKILLTGKPIYANNEYRPGHVTGMTTTVDDAVTDPRANYVLAIGGNTHNYQRYPVTVTDGRAIQYLVSGGGGAYLSATHKIPPVNMDTVDESAFRCYPLRRDSLARFSQIIDRKLFGGKGKVVVDPAVAGRYFEQRGIVTPESGRAASEALSITDRIKASTIRRIPTGRFFHRFGSAVFSFDEPPFFKQFLRIDITREEIAVSCLGVTGCAGTEHTPSLEDYFTISLRG